jgi:acyl-homoserine lactone acylase PvdQ
MIMVPSNGDYDWMNEDWTDTQQEIEVVQGETSATVTGLTGRSAQTGPHVIEVLSPRIVRPGGSSASR